MGCFFVPSCLAGFIDVAWLNSAKQLLWTVLCQLGGMCFLSWQEANEGE